MGNGIDFFQTPMGRQFYDSTMPTIAKALNRIAVAMDKNSDGGNPTLRIQYLAEVMTKENMLKNASEEELFCLFHTFKEYWNELFSPDVFKPTDKQIGEVVARLQRYYKK